MSSNGKLPSRNGADAVCDVIVVGTGATGLVAALTLASAGLSVRVIEKSDQIGGTSAMSGGMTWIPANHYADAAGLPDSKEEALAYIRAAAPPGWQEAEDTLWQQQVEHGPAMLKLVETQSPLRFSIVEVADPMMDLSGAKELGRLLTPEPIPRRLAGPFRRNIRRSTLPLPLTFREVGKANLYRRPYRGTLRYSGTLLWRWLTGVAVRGNALIVGLLKGCLDHGCQVQASTRVVELTTDPADGAVTGAVVECRGTRTTIHARRGVILATGGFEWNAEMLKTYFPAEVDFLSSPRTNEGDGHRMAAAAGARFDHMEQANIIVQPPLVYEGALHGMPLKVHAEPDAIVVNAQGRRFVNEYDFQIAEIFTDLDPATGRPRNNPAWVISQWEMVKRTPLIRFYKHHDPTWLVTAQTLPALAERIGVPADALSETVARFNRFAAQGVDPDFNRGATHYEKKLAAAHGLVSPITRPPYVAYRFKASILGTKGGVRTNAAGQATRADGSIIPGLYCAGSVMANPTGARTPSQTGTTLGPYMTWGYICARSILRDNRASGAGGPSV